MMALRPRLPRAEDRKAIARTDLQVIESRSRAGLNAAAERTQYFQGHVVRNLDDVAFRADGIGREGRLAEEVTVHILPIIAQIATSTPGLAQLKLSGNCS
jgi:hypothetical protein